MKNKTRIAGLALAFAMLLPLAACGAETAQPTAQTKSSQALMEEENAVLDAHHDLWMTVFDSMDTSAAGEAKQENYGDLLQNAVDALRDTLSEEEYRLLTEDAAKIRALEEEIAALPPETAQSASSGMANAVFPAFTATDLDGNPVDSSVIGQNAYTILNFWYNGCKPCVEELDSLQKISEEAQAAGGELFGVNVETLDGSADATETAKQILASKGANYRNLRFDSASEAGKLALDLTAFPTTFVLDRSGTIVGEPILGSIVDDAARAELQARIDRALARNAEAEN